MELEKYSKEIFNVLNTDETLLRLLHYLPKSKTDNPLDVNKPDITKMDMVAKWEIIDNNIMEAPKTSDLVKNQVCRLFYYPGHGDAANSNYLFTHQEFHFDVFVHAEIQKNDRRNHKICDRVNEIIFGKYITGMGKMLSVRRHPINAPMDYLAYRLVYKFVSDN